MRLWVGVWIGVFMIILCAFEISAWVAFITRFTEENFALLIATIFIYKAIEKVLSIGHKYPLTPPVISDCVCYPPDNYTDDAQPVNWTDVSWEQCKSV